MTKDEMDEMNEQLGTARVVETWLEEGVQQLPQREEVPNDLLRRIIVDVEQSPQQTRRLGWWARLGLGSGSGSDGDRSTTRRLAVAAMASVVVLVGLGVVVQTVVRAPTDVVGHFIVASDGNGFDTIAAAVAEAADGEIVLVRPGTYAEAIVIDKSIILKGDGPVEDIIITAPPDGPVHEASSSLLGGSGSYAIVIEGADPSISGITLQGASARIFVDGGSATLEGLVFDVGTGRLADGRAGIGSSIGGLGSLIIDRGATPTVRDSTFSGEGLVHVFDDSDPVIERNVFSGGFAVWADFGDRAVVRGNRFADASGTAIAFLGPTAATIEGNEISGSAIAIAPSSGYSGTGFAPVIVDNVIRGNTLGILMPEGSAGEIRGNEITSSALAISLTNTRTMVADNELGGNARGILVAGGSPMLDGNTVTDGTTGLHVQGLSNPSLVGNTICDNEMNIAVTDGATRPDTSGDEICPDPAS